MKGFTLVEVLVAMAIMAVAGAGLMQLVNVAGLSVRDARVDMVETFAAESKMAELRAGLGVSPGGSIVSAVSDYRDYVSIDGAFVSTSVGPAAAYDRRWQVTPAPYDPLNTLVLQVVVTRLGRPQAREVHLVSLLTSAGQ